MLDQAAAALIVLTAGVLVVVRRHLAAIWFRMEDPRTVGLFRIVFGALLLANLISLAPLHEYLYTAEGLLTGEQARAKYGKHWFSLLYEFDSIEFVTAYCGILWIACAAFTLGLATSITKWITWLLFIGLYARTGPASQGDHVFAGFAFYLCLSRCGESFSVDAWIRRRRDPCVPRHRAIPAWPRNLMLLSMIPMMCANGLAKAGRLWRDGDMFHVVLNEPIYQPFSMWEVSAVFGTNLFRVMTWVTHAFEILFPLVLVGIVVDLLRRAELPALGRPAVWIGRVLLLAIGIDVLVLADARLAAHELPHAIAVAAGLAIAAAPLTLGLARRIPERARRWLLGRRVWATLLVMFSGALFFVLRIDWFTGVPMACAILLFEGDELARAWSRLTRRPARPTGPARAIRGPLLRRRFVALLSGFHVLAVALIVLPHAKPPAPWRQTVERPLKWWVHGTVGIQFWAMFAEGDRGWVRSDLELVVHDGQGDAWAVGDGILPVGDDRALDRREKIRSNLRRSEPLRVAHARWVCRNFDASSRDDLTVTFYKVVWWVPTPEQLAELGPEEASARVEASRSMKEIDRHRCGD
jgi:hypothetical protein